MSLISISRSCEYLRSTVTVKPPLKIDPPSKSIGSVAV
jgi:hypothetical protein